MSDNIFNMGFLKWLSGKESACRCKRHRRRRFDPWVGKIPWRRVWQPTPVFLPEESHGKRSLAGSSSQGRKESDTVERLSLYFTSMVICHFRHWTYLNAAKLLQSCPTLCDPIDGSPPGSPVPGILQARTLEWVAISFSNA